MSNKGHLFSESYDAAGVCVMWEYDALVSFSLGRGTRVCHFDI